MNWLRVLALVFCAAVSVPAQAHAFLEHAEPRVGATVPAAPGKLTLTFSQEIEPAFSTVKVTDAKGQPVDKGDVHVDGALMQVSLGAIGSGDYTVTWRVVSTDTHVTEGDFVFHVGP
jgi:methionine-rich copper-binding protein CopC